MQAVGEYFHALVDRFGRGWNRFWFTPSDPLTLGVIRVLTALVALGLYLTYWPDLDEFFGPSGLLSENAILQMRFGVPLFSIFDHAGSPAALHWLFWIGAGVIALFLVGLFTRVTAVLAFICFVSILLRGPMLAPPVDDIVALLMLYLCLGPCGRTLSLDALIARARGAGSAALAKATWTATLPIRLIQVHLSAIYFAMAIAKLKSPEWWGGMAVAGLMRRPESRLIDLTWISAPLGDYIINAWTLAIVAFELGFAILIWNRLARPLLLAVALPMWIGMALLTGNVSFALIMLVANLAFVPAATFRCCLDRRAATAPAD